MIFHNWESFIADSYELTVDSLYLIVDSLNLIAYSW